MLKIYIKMAFRSFWAHRTHSVINIVGLSVGLASSFIIILFSFQELNYDRYNKNLDSIYLATTEMITRHRIEPRSPFLLGSVLKSECPEVQEFARVMRSRCPVRCGAKTFDAEYCLCADFSIFQILTFPLESGSLQGLAPARDVAVISDQMAHKIFGARNPIGEIITVDWLGDSYDLMVAAVMKDIPHNSTLRGEIVVPLHIAEKWFLRLLGRQSGNALESWTTMAFPTYVLLSHPRTANQLENMMASFSKRHVDTIQGTVFHLFPLKDLYYHSSSITVNFFPSGTLSIINAYSAIAFLILLIACLNFIILSLGRSAVRTKEIAVRKVVGASRFDLMKQIMIESVTLAVIALPLALLLVELFLPVLGHQLGKEIPEISPSNLNYLAIFSAVTLLAGIVSGSYVAVYLSRLHPLVIMRSKVSTGGSRATLRKFMIGFQMIIFIGLMMASVTIYRQMQYFHDKDLGFDKNDLIVLSSHPPRIGSTSDPSRFDFARFLALKSELESDPFVVKVSGAQSFPGTEGGTFGNIPVPSDPSRMVRYQELSVDRDFVETMKMQMVSGESFARAAPEESKRTVIVNESAINALGFSDLSQAMIQDKRILGVVRDFNFGSLHQSVPPMVIRCDTMEPHEIAVRVRQGADREKALSSILQMSAKFNNGTPMSFQFFDDRLDDLYGDDYRFGWMIGYFTALAIFITCLGLFGVSLFTVHTRVKEVGIRKVMGASAGSIFYLLAREFIVLTLGSALVAVPVSILFINRWLENYAYKVGIDVVVVLKVTLLAIAIVVSTIVLQVFRAARANPVEALRCE